MKTILFFIPFLFIFGLNAQTEDAWIYFSDKPGASYYYANPLEMLSPRSLQRRQTQNIALDINDVPLHPAYVTQIENTPEITLVAKSKWLNCVHVQGLYSEIESLKNNVFVQSVQYANSSLNSRTTNSKKEFKTNRKLEVTTSFNYGSAANQIQMLHGDYLHQQNFSGTGMHIAVLDAGFTNVNTMSAFNRIRNDNQILGTYNFVDRATDVYFRHYHGTMVLSTMAGFFDNQYVGTAPDASYYLFITEDGNQEHPYEESLWVEAAEKADSLGVDIINSSLGYTDFDRSEYNHTYADMDGQTTFISRGAEIAFSKGILVVNSAGNSGSSTWHFIGAPADAISVLSIGSVNANTSISSFSSWGPNANGILKPDVCAQGGASAIIDTNNQIVFANGTSFSSPILAGAAACFWQAFPTKTNVQIAQAIKESAHLFATPNNQYGYGIPNFETAYDLLRLEELALDYFSMFPNPVSREQLLSISMGFWKPNSNLIISDLTGKIVQKQQINSIDIEINLNGLSKGLYIVSLQNDDYFKSQKLLIK